MRNIGRNIGLVPDDKQVKIEFTTAASRGETHFMVRINPRGFSDFASAMMASDRKTAIKAFGTALLKG